MSDLDVKRAADAQPSVEYGCLLRRILPWDNPVPSPEGMGIATVPPGARTAPHCHDEWEHFVILQGKATVWIDGRAAELGEGDAIRVPPLATHSLENRSAAEALRFLTVWSMAVFGAPPGDPEAGLAVPRLGALPGGRP